MGLEIMTEKNKHLIGGVEPKYYARIPNMAIDDLPYAELALYTYYKRVAYDTGSCWQSTATVGKSLKMSPKKVRATRRALEDRGLVYVGASPQGGTKTIRITNVWRENIDRYNVPPVQNDPPPGTKRPTPGSNRTHKEKEVITNKENKDSVAQKQSDAVAADMEGDLPNSTLCGYRDVNGELMYCHNCYGEDICGADNGDGDYLYKLPITEAAIIATLKAVHDNPDGVAVNADAFNVAAERELIVHGKITPGGYELIGVDIDDSTDNAWLEQHALEGDTRMGLCPACGRSKPLGAKCPTCVQVLFTGDDTITCTGSQCGGATIRGAYYLPDGDGHPLCPGCWLARKHPLLDMDSKLSGDEIQHAANLAAELAGDIPDALTETQYDMLKDMEDHGVDNRGNWAYKDAPRANILALSDMGYCKLLIDANEWVATDNGRAALEAWQLLQKEQQVEIDYPAAKVAIEAWQEGTMQKSDSANEPKKMTVTELDNAIYGTRNAPVKAVPQLPIGDDVNSDDIDEPLPPPEQVKVKKKRKAPCTKCESKTRKIVEDGKCWECCGYPDRAKMIDTIYGILEWPKTKTMYGKKNMAIMTRLAQWGATLEKLTDYAHWMIQYYNDKNWTLPFGSFNKEDMWHIFNASSNNDSEEFPRIDAPLYADPPPYPPELIAQAENMTREEVEALEAKVRKKITGE